MKSPNFVLVARVLSTGPSTIPLLAEATGLTVTAIRGGIAYLIQKGWVHSTGNAQRRMATYTLAVPLHHIDTGVTVSLLTAKALTEAWPAPVGVPRETTSA